MKAFRSLADRVDDVEEGLGRDGVDPQGEDDEPVEGAPIVGRRDVDKFAYNESLVRKDLSAALPGRKVETLEERVGGLKVACDSLRGALESYESENDSKGLPAAKSSMWKGVAKKIASLDEILE